MSALVARLRDSLLSGESFRGILAIMAGAGGAQAVVIAAQPILTRIYSPSDFGVFGVAGALFSIITVVACLRYEYAIPLAPDSTTAANIVALCLIATMITSLLAMGILFVAAPLFISATASTDLSPYGELLAISVIGAGFLQSFTGLATRMKAYSAIALNRLVVGVGTVVIQIGLGTLGWTATGLLAGVAGGEIAGSVRYAWAARRNHNGAHRLVTRTGIVAAAKRYRRFPTLAAPSAFLNAIGIQLPLLLFVGIYGAAAGGLFALAQRVIGLPLVLIAIPAGHTYHAESARAVRESPLQVRDVYIRTTRTLALVMIGPTILAAILSPILFGTIFGEEWATAGLYVTILAPMYFLLSVFSPTGSTLYVLERQELHLLQEVLRIVLVGGAVVVAAFAGLQPMGALVMISIAGCIAYASYGSISWLAILAAERKARAAGST
jgi:O-antigen/teichoic acid export membrane protein